MPRKSNKKAAPKRTKRRAIRGHGDYTVDKNNEVNPMVNKILRQIGSAVGGIGASALGIPSAIGSSAGGFVADKGHRLFKKITGLGDYNISQNTLLTDEVPQFANISHRETRVIHREYVGELMSSNDGSLKIQSYALNPSNSALFPWLSAVAQNYQQYRLNGCIIYLKSLSANALNSTNTNLGQTLIATNYNINAANFRTSQAMLNSEFSNSGKPSSDIIHMIECKRNETTLNELYIDNSSVKVGDVSDRRFYDFCNIQIGSAGMQTTVSIPVCQIWVSYDMTLLKSISSNNVLYMDNYYLTYNGVTDTGLVSFYPGGGPDPNDSIIPTSNFGTKLVKGTPALPSNDYNTIMIPKDFSGTICLEISALGAVGTLLNVTPSNILSSGISLLNVYGANASPFFTNLNDGNLSGTAIYSCYYNVKYVGDDHYITIVNWLQPGNITYKNIIVTTVPNLN